MSKRTRRHHSAEQKAEALRRHHVKKEEVSSICEDLKLNPSVFYHWQRNLFVSGMREGEIARTGQLVRIVFNEKWEEMRRESLLRDLHQRIRDVRQGPDGLLYVITDEGANSVMLRIEPA